MKRSLHYLILDSDFYMFILVCFCIVCIFSDLLFNLKVIPQLIARIDTPRSLVGRLVHQLLVDIGKAHPQVGKQTYIS